MGTYTMSREAMQATPIIYSYTDSALLEATAHLAIQNEIGLREGLHTNTGHIGRQETPSDAVPNAVGREIHRYIACL